MNKFIEIIVRGLLIKDGHLLVCHNSKNLYAYLPGGHVEFWETREQALQREWQEELACQCQIGTFLRQFEDRFIDTKGEKFHEYAFLYRVSCESLKPHQPLPHPEPDLFFEWIPLSDVKQRNILPTTMRDYISEICKSQVRRSAGIWTISKRTIGCEVRACAPLS